jgi:lysophospholipase L1-like esterase
MKRRLPFLALVLLARPVPADFAIRDGDTMVFLGDSITAARQYGKVIENYCLLRFPERKVRFVNAGHGGETARGSLERLEKDVFGVGTTLVTVAYGVNDIGWGMKADEAHRKDYLDAIGELVDRCKARGVRVFICSAAITAEDPDRAEKGFLQTMCDAGLEIARSKGAGAIDVQRAMREVQRRVLAANSKQPDPKKHERMHVDDGVHLNDLGQFAMAFAILKGLGAPAEVSAASVDAGAATVTEASGCRITGVKRTDDGLSFNRADDRLPLNLAPLWMLHGFYIPIGEELNRYQLTVTGLPEGRYEVAAGGRALGAWSAAELARGINIASATQDPWEPGGPWDAQGHAVKVFTDMRDELALARRNMDRTLTSHPKIEALRSHAAAIEEDLITLQREMAQPVPVEFAIKKERTR